MPLMENIKYVPPPSIGTPPHHLPTDSLATSTSLPHTLLRADEGAMIIGHEMGIMFGFLGTY